MKEEAPNCLINLTPKIQQTTRTRINLLPTFHCRTDCFKNSFKNSKRLVQIRWISIFKSRLLSFIRPLKSNVYNIFDPIGLKFLTCLRLGFSHLNEHRFRHNLQDCMNPLCSCSLEIEDTSHYVLHCHHFSQYHIDLMNRVKSILENFESLSDNVKKNILL